jgi:pyruvate dehydrogenase E2 component (dihydrolipoamide acetyltransferase)
MASPPILMPKLGLTMTEGVLAEWKVAVGDTVAAGDVLFVVETDKISNEVDAQAAGTISALHAAEGETLPVGAVLVSWVDDSSRPNGEVTTAQTADDGKSHSEPAAAAGAMLPNRPAVGSPPLPSMSKDGKDRILATPLARRMAAQAGITLADIAGSGPRGRVTADDVAASVASALRQAQAERKLVPAPSSVSSPPSPTRPEPIEGPAPTSAQPASIPLSPYQRTTARRLTEAKRDIPHFYVQAEADVTDLLRLRKQLNADADHTKLTVSHFLVTALARTLAGLPAMNRVWADDHLRDFATVDIGMAVETPKGLVAPVLRDLGRLTSDEVAAAADALVARARASRLAPEDLTGGAIAISNVGMFGASALVPIVNPGQSSILGVGAAAPTFRPDTAGAPVLRQVLTLTLSCDHRVIDGALAARFLQALVRRLESPADLLRRPSPQEPAS